MSRSPKRYLDISEDVTTFKRQKVAYHRHHGLRYKPQDVPTLEPALVEPVSTDRLLVKSIKTITEEQALQQDIYEPLIESVALEGLRSAAEEFIVKLCSLVRQSMLAARRTAPIAPDFETAIDILDLPRPDDQLRSYQTKYDINPPLLPTPPPDDPFHDHVNLPESFLGSELGNQNDLKRFSFNVTSLPPLPSAHTYKDTAVYTQRETDSRKMRELATEEGKLGEQALRKLAGAVKLDAAHPVDAETKQKAVPPPRLTRRRRKPDLSEEAVFEETVRDLLKAEPEGFELGPIVTAEKAYRMPDEAQIKRRPIKMENRGGSTLRSDGAEA